MTFFDYFGDGKGKGTFLNFFYGETMTLSAILKDKKMTHNLSNFRLRACVFGIWGCFDFTADHILPIKQAQDFGRGWGRWSIYHCLVCRNC